MDPATTLALAGLAPRNLSPRAAKRLAKSHRASLILIDTSGSMQALDDTGKSRIARLHAAIHRHILDHANALPVLYRFNSDCRHTVIDAEPWPLGGTTDLANALQNITEARPVHTLIATDGRPDDEADAIRAADDLPGIIDVLYVGDDDPDAIQFCEKLARRCGGKLINLAAGADARQIGSAIDTLRLPAPPKE